MRRVFLIMLLAVMCSSAMAEWVGVGGNDKIRSYANPSTIRKDGNKAKILTLYDYMLVQKIAGYTLLSMTQQNEFDCNDKQTRTLTFSFHSGNMGTGKVVYSHTSPTVWRPVLPDSLNDATLKFACGKR